MPIMRYISTASPSSVRAVHTLHRLRHAQVGPLSTRQRQAALQRLPNEAVRELPTHLATCGDGLNQLRRLCFLKCREEHVSLGVTQCLQQREVEAAAHHGRGCEHLASRWTESFEAPADYQTNAFRDIEVFDSQVCPPLSLLVEESPFFRQVWKTSSTKNGLPSVSAKTAVTNGAGGD